MYQSCCCSWPVVLNFSSEYYDFTVKLPFNLFASSFNTVLTSLTVLSYELLSNSQTSVLWYHSIHWLDLMDISSKFEEIPSRWDTAFTIMRKTTGKHGHDYRLGLKNTTRTWAGATHTHTQTKKSLSSVQHNTLIVKLNWSKHLNLWGYNVTSNHLSAVTIRTHAFYNMNRPSLPTPLKQTRKS